MTKEDRHLKLTGEWGRKARKMNQGSERRNNMKEETIQELDDWCPGGSCKYAGDCYCSDPEYHKKKKETTEIEKLKAEIKNLKQERNQWKAKAKASYYSAWTSFGYRCTTTAQMEKEFNSLMEKLFG